MDLYNLYIVGDDGLRRSVHKRTLKANRLSKQELEQGGVWGHEPSTITDVNVPSDRSIVFGEGAKKIHRFGCFGEC